MRIRTRWLESAFSEELGSPVRVLFWGLIILVQILVAKVYHFWYTFAMSYYEKIYEYAADNYGLITSAKAKELDIPNVELAKLSNRGRLARIGHGIYRINHYVPTPLDKFAEAVAIVGEDAYVYEESVLAMHGLAFVNPTAIYIATPRRIRKNLPEHIKAVHVKNNSSITHYEGILSQCVVSAILSCRGRIMADRLENAINEAEHLGLITKKEAKNARKGLRYVGQ